MTSNTCQRRRWLTMFCASFAISTIQSTSALASVVASSGSSSTATRPLSTNEITTNTGNEGGTGVHVPVGKDGDGEYTAATKGCFDVIHTAQPAILQEIINQQQQQPLQLENNHQLRPYHIADYGTADGGTSLGLISNMIKTLRKQQELMDDDNIGNVNSPREVVIHYEDQLTNEWQSVFRHVLGLKSVQDAYGNNIETPMTLGNVYAEGCGVGFHHQCYPSSSIDFGISFTAMHWLSRCDVTSLQDTPYMHAARCPTRPEPERIQAAEDWISILQARKRELVPGGRFVCVNFCVSKDGYFLGQTDTGTSMWDSFQVAWDRLKAQGLIDEEERLGVSFPSYYRTMDEFLQGIDAVGGLKVVSAEERIVPCPYRELYVKGQNDNDSSSGNAKSTMTPRQYAEWFVPTTRTWSHSTFQSALKADRTDKEKVMEQFWENYMSLVEDNPSDHGMDYVHAYLVLEKI